MRLLFLIFFLVSGHVSAAGDVELARQARHTLLRSKHALGFIEKVKCFSSKVLKGKKWTTIKEECVKDLQALGVTLAVAREGEDSLTLIHVSGIPPCMSETPGYETFCHLNVLKETNGLNTHFVIQKPEGYKVYGIRRISNPEDPTYAVYTPYSDALNTPAVQEEGRKYVDSVIDKALHHLRARGVRSRIDPNRMVADLAPKGVFRRLVLIEHIDVYRFRREPFRKLVREVYTTYGLNQENAYSFSKSRARAHGMFQIIRSTYYTILRKYPEADLNQDFALGTQDHVNAAMTAILLADYNIGLLPKETRSVLLASQMVGEYVASSYNGDPARPIRILKANQDFVTHNENFENKYYVMKMRATSDSSL